MHMIPAVPVTYRGARMLDANDIERVVAIDRAHTGQARRRFFEKRFAAAEASPDDFVHIGVMRGGSLRGFIMAHLQRGEFGREDIIAVFDAIGVELESQERGVGQNLIDELLVIMRRKGVRTLQSQSDWTQHDVLHFLDTSGFSLSPRLIIERSVSEPLIEVTEDV